ncbi:MAG: glycoside hydrolase family protein [Thioalkalispiraceae bacterium]|jgi:GH24 family phage-related lysozyme (muramidase)
MLTINASVGRDGVNYKRDVRLVQGLLNQYTIPRVTTPLKIDGVIGDRTIQRIETFQKKILHFARPDGRVDPDGRTINKLLKRPGTKPASDFKLSRKATDLLKAIEGLRLKPYNDQTGKTIHRWVKGATIGYGHLIARRAWKQYKHGITRSAAEALFNTDLAPFVAKVQDSISANILQQEFDALVILTFNIGRTAFGNSSVRRLINNPGANTSYPNLEKAWKAWNKSQGRYNRGLANRRHAEWKMYTKGVYQRW